MTTATINATIAAPAIAVVRTIGAMVEMLKESKGGNVLVVSYRTNMLGKGKLRAAAKAAFPNGIWREATKAVQIGYSYEKKMENRGDEAANNGKTWQQAVLNSDGGISALTTHKTKGGYYLRYEPLTDKQKACGFGAADTSRFIDDDGNEIDAEKVKPFYFDRKATTVQHRTLTITNAFRMKYNGTTYEINRSA